MTAIRRKRTSEKHSQSEKETKVRFPKSLYRELKRSALLRAGGSLNRLFNQLGRKITLQDQRKLTFDELQIIGAIRDGHQEIEQLQERTELKKDRLKELLDSLVYREIIEERKRPQLHEDQRGARKAFYVLLDESIGQAGAS